MDITLKSWLNQEPLPEEISSLEFRLGVAYLPISVARQKIAIMEDKFGANVTQTEVTVSAINTFHKDTCFMSTVKFVIEHPDFPNGSKTICGTASLFAGQYNGSWSFAQIAESLATVRAFNKHWNQFGKGLNKEEDPTANMKAPALTPKSNLSKTINHVTKK